MRIMLVDNYDSFTWNLHHYLFQITENVDVFLNDDIRCLDITGYDGVVISPGPGLPSESGYTPEILLRFFDKIAILGICLGHQAIVEHFGGALINIPSVLHGVQCKTIITDEKCVLFKSLPNKIETGHYHSWIADPVKLPSSLNITAVTESSLIMAVEHRDFNVKSVQFHPESVLTPSGFTIIKNWTNNILKVSNIN